MRPRPRCGRRITIARSLIMRGRSVTMLVIAVTIKNIGTVNRPLL